MKYNITKIVAAGLPSRLYQWPHSNAPATKNNIAGSGKNIWQWNYYEHIIRDEKKLAKIRNYIERNPEKEIDAREAIEN